MVDRARLEASILAALGTLRGPQTPPRLSDALHHALVPGGGRVRPLLTLYVADACGDRHPGVADAAAAAVELLHCASLVHDDLPCFDDAATRRGRPSVHAAFGEALAVLTGDALIAGALQHVATAAGQRAPRLAGALVGTLAAGVGSHGGLVAGQAWESEAHVDLRTYHRAKTGALFIAAVAAGAIAGGGDPDAWVGLGRRLGEAYQVADDLRDVFSHARELGKPVGQDAMHGRPSAVTELGATGAYARLQSLLQATLEAIPRCPGRAAMRLRLAELCGRVFPARRADPSDAYAPIASALRVA